MKKLCVDVTEDEIDLAHQIGAKCIRSGMTVEEMTEATEEGARLTKLLGDRVASRIIKLLMGNTCAYATN